MDAKNLYWLAGIFEGEGWYSLSTSKNAVAGVTMTDRDVIEKVAKLLNHFYVAKKPHNHAHKDQWNIVLSGRKAAALMMTLYALMGSRRKEKIREVLSIWNKTPVRYPNGRVSKTKRAIYPA